MISIIVPVYNVEKYISECVHSLMAQTHQDIEIILVVDGATDTSGQLCDALALEDQRIRVLHKKNGGVSSARNLGIVSARGEYIMFVDGDDWIEPNTIETMLKHIVEEHVDACYCKRYFKDCTVESTGIPELNNNRISSDTAVRLHLKGTFIASGCLALVCRDKVKNCLFDEQLSMMEDWEYNFRQLNAIDSLFILDQPLYHYRTVMGSASTSGLSEKKMSCMLIPDKVEQYVAANHLPYALEAKYVRVYMLYHMLVLLSNGRYHHNIAARLARQARKTLPYVLRTDWIPLNQKIYMLSSAVTPKIFCWAYAMKYRRNKSGR